MTMNTSKYWSLFNELNEYWAEIADARPLHKEVRLIQSTLRKKGFVLDLCCGTGRHTISLRRKGFDTIGFDISPNLLKIAKRRMKENQINTYLVRGDMRHLPFKSELFMAVLNMFTSFGYLPSEKDDVDSLTEISRVLKDDGSFIVDIVNREHLMKVFRPRDWGEYPSFYMLETRRLDDDGMMLHSQWIILDKIGGKHLFIHNLRLYTLKSLGKLLKSAGLNIKDIYGNYDKGKFNKEAERLILVTTKADFI